jgi:hypothetical protein
MAPSIKRHPQFFRKLKSANTSQRNHYINNATDDEIDSVCECALNLCRGNIPLTCRQKKLLFPHRNTIRRIAHTQDSDEARQLLKQRGGFLPALAAAVIPIIADLIIRQL